MTTSVPCGLVYEIKAMDEITGDRSLRMETGRGVECVVCGDSGSLRSTCLYLYTAIPVYADSVCAWVCVVIEWG